MTRSWSATIEYLRPVFFRVAIHYCIWVGGPIPTEQPKFTRCEELYENDSIMNL